MMEIRNTYFWLLLLLNCIALFFLSQGEDTEWVVVEYENAEPSNDDWIGVFSPAKFK